MCNLRIVLFLFVSFSSVLAKNKTNISDSLAVETTIHTVKSPTFLPSETKSKTGKRDSSDQIGPFEFKGDESFRPITGKSYQKIKPLPQQLQSSQAPSTFQPTTVRYIAEGADPQAYYNRPPTTNPVPITSIAGSVTNFVEQKGHYGITGHSYRGPFKEPYQLQLEKTHPQTLQQQSQYLLKPHYNQQQYIQPANVLQNYGSQSLNADNIPLEGPLQLRQHAPDHLRHLYTQQRQINQNEQQRQPNQQQLLIQKQLEQKPQYSAFERHTYPQYQQSARQNHYIIAIPLSYIRQLQYQSAAEHGRAPAPAQQQVAIPLPLSTSHVSLPPLLVLQPARVGTLNREHFLTQTPTHYAPHGPTQSNSEVSAHAAAPPALALQQLPFTLSLILKEIARSRPTGNLAPQLSNVQSQLIRNAPQKPQVKQRNKLQHNAQASDQQQPHVIDERNAHQAQHNFQPQQQHEGNVLSVNEPAIKEILASSHSTATAAESQSPLLPQSQLASTASPSLVSPPIFFYNPVYVQASEQHQVPPYAKYIPVQFGTAPHAATEVKLSSPSSLFASQTAQAPPFHSVHPLQPSLNGPVSLVAAISPQTLILTKGLIQKPVVHMTKQNAVNSIGPSWSGGGLPYIIHPAGLHYGTHLYNSGIPLAISKRLESGTIVDANKQQSRQYLRTEQDGKPPQQQLAPPVTSDGNNGNNVIAKYP